MFKLKTCWASDVWQWSASCFKCQWSLTMSWASPSECATLRRMVQFGCLIICLVVCVVCRQVNNGVLRLYYRIARWSRVHWNAKNLLVVGEGACPVKKDRISCSFLMFFNMFTAFQRCWVNSKTAPRVTSSGRNYVGRLNACEGICVGNSFPLPILSPNPMVHPVVQHDFHCCQFKDFKAVYVYKFMRCWVVLPTLLEDVGG